MRAVPADGTYLRVRQEQVFLRVAGGAALRLTDCAVLDGNCTAAVPVDPGTLERNGAISGSARLGAIPRDGTILHARPSDSRWGIVGGRRQPSASTPTDVQVNDSTIESFATLPTETPGPGGSSGPEGPTGGSVSPPIDVDSAACTSARSLVRKRKKEVTAAKKAVRRATSAAKRKRAQAVMRRRAAALKRAYRLRSERCA